MIRKYFSAGNTPVGFVNLFDKTIDAAAAVKLVYIKGGSGVGKSTLMKRVSAPAEEDGEEVIHLYCSGDSRSLDGVILPARGVCLYDATAPHVMEPKYPALNGEIVNLAVYLDEEKVRRHSASIKSIVAEKGAHYFSLYNYMAAAGRLYENMSADLVRDKSIANIADEIYNRIDKSVAVTPADGFITCVDREGVTSFLADAVKGKRVVNIDTEYPQYGKAIVSRIVDRCRLDGVSFEGYRCLIEPEKYESLIVGDTAVTVGYEGERDVEYMIDGCGKIKNEFAYNKDKAYFDGMLHCACSELRAAQDAHKKLEKYYTSAMDFDGPKAEAERLIKEIYG